MSATWSVRNYRTRTARHHRAGRERLNIGDLRAFLIAADEAGLPEDTGVRVTVEAASEGGGCRVTVEASATQELGEELS